MSTGTAMRQFGTGPLARTSAFIYTLLVTEFWLLVTAGPGLAAVLLLGRDASNLPLVALCLVPAGPALSAALFAVHHRRLDLADLHPTAAFWRGYRLNGVGVLCIYVPWLAALTMVAIVLVHRRLSGVPGWWLVLLALLTVAACLWLSNALVITSLFRFRAIDVARLAAYFLGRTPMAALGNAGLLVLAAAVTAAATEVTLFLLVPVFGLMLLHNSRTLITQVRQDFTT